MFFSAGVTIVAVPDDDREALPDNVADPDTRAAVAECVTNEPEREAEADSVAEFAVSAAVAEWVTAAPERDAEPKTVAASADSAPVAVCVAAPAASLNTMRPAAQKLFAAVQPALMALVDDVT